VTLTMNFPPPSEKTCVAATPMPVSAFPISWVKSSQDVSMRTFFHWPSPAFSPSAGETVASSGRISLSTFAPAGAGLRTSHSRMTPSGMAAPASEGAGFEAW